MAEPQRLRGRASEPLRAARQAIPVDLTEHFPITNSSAIECAMQVEDAPLSLRFIRYKPERSNSTAESDRECSSGAFWHLDSTWFCPRMEERAEIQGSQRQLNSEKKK